MRVVKRRVHIGFGLRLAACLLAGIVGSTPGPAGAEEAPPTYAIRQVLIQGAGVFKPDTLQALYAPALSRPVSEADVAALAESVSEYYRRGGYFLASASVPKQRLDYGLLVLHVDEGEIKAVRVEGDPALYTPPLRAAIKRLLTVQPMTEPAFTQAMTAFAAVPTLHTAARFVPSEGAMGQYDLVLSLSRKDAAPLPTAAGKPAESAKLVVPASVQSGPALASTAEAVPSGELAPDLMERGPQPETSNPERRSAAIGPFYVPRPDGGRQDAYALLDHGPGWYKRSEDTNAIPAALGLRLSDAETKVGFEAGIPYDNRVDGSHGGAKNDEVQVLFTVDRPF